jgi:adenosylcobyric acid synthase
VVPWLEDPGLEEEDGVAAEQRPTPSRAWPEESGPGRRLRVAVVALPHLANFTDFDALAAEPSVAVAWIERPGDVAPADLVVLPGTKQTLDDLRWLAARGLGEAIAARAHAGGATLGVCGGLQMLGRRVEDAGGLEGGGGAAGLDLLPLTTRLGREKTVARAEALGLESPLFGIPAGDGPRPRGYEIHLGETRLDPGAAPLLRLRREGRADPVPDGAVSSSGAVAGSYLHGLLDDDGFRHAVVAALRRRSGLAPAEDVAAWSRERHSRFERLAAHVRDALDIPALARWIDARAAPELPALGGSRAC